MMSYWLLLILGVLLIGTLTIIFYPLRRQRLILISLAPLLFILVGGAYWYWGAWSAWHNHLQHDAQQKRAREILKTMKGPREVAEKLKKHLERTPDSARGWFLLGRLYASQNEWQSAQNAFARAHALQPQDEQIVVNYAQSLYVLNQQKFNEYSRNLLKTVLDKNSNQPDALAMLAMDAYSNSEYEKAINYWQRLLQVVPRDSEEAEIIQKAIIKAQKNW